MPRQGRKVNWKETKRIYKERISHFPTELWEDLNGAYLGTFDIYSTVENIEEDAHMDCFAGIILRMAREKGYTPLGVTTERKSKGVHLCPLLLDEERREDCKIVYVGKYSYFSNHQKSAWSPIASDYVYISN